jgi:hypothetical protein
VEVLLQVGSVEELAHLKVLARIHGE